MTAWIPERLAIAALVLGLLLAAIRWAAAEGSLVAGVVSGGDLLPGGAWLGEPGSLAAWAALIV